MTFTLLYEFGLLICLPFICLAPQTPPTNQTYIIELLTLAIFSCNRDTPPTLPPMLWRHSLSSIVYIEIVPFGIPPPSPGFPLVTCYYQIGAMISAKQNEHFFHLLLLLVLLLLPLLLLFSNYLLMMMHQCKSSSSFVDVVVIEGVHYLFVAVVFAIVSLFRVYGDGWGGRWSLVTTNLHTNVEIILIRVFTY